MTKQHHLIEIFSGDCPLCKHVTDDIQCEGCRQVIYDLKNMTNEIKRKMKDYDVRAVPTTIIDNKIKVVGIPDFPWICGEDLYKKLSEEYHL